MDDDIPALTSPDDTPPVRTQQDLHRLWRALMGPLGFGGRSLWLALLHDDGRPTSVIVQVEDLPPLPDREQREHLARFCRMLLDQAGGGQVVFLLSRPGRGGISEGDRRWAAALQDVVRRARLPVWPVHRADDVELVVIAPDDLAASA